MCAARSRRPRSACFWCPCQGTSSSSLFSYQRAPRRTAGAPRASMHPRTPRAHLSRFEIWTFEVQITIRKVGLWVGAG